MRFGNENRVRLARDFTYIKENSVKADCSAFVFYCLPRPESSVSRIGIVASKRVGDAVERNTAKRRFRAIFRETAPQFKSRCDILVFVRRGYSRFEYSRLSQKFLAAANVAMENAAQK